MNLPKLVLCVLLVSVAACQPAPPPIVVVPPSPAAPVSTPTPAPIRVYVSGAVVNPNKVYLLPAHSIGEDAIKAAGGATAAADWDKVNLAKELSDQEHFHVPSKSQAGPVLLSPAAKRININTATVQELEQLPKIGPATAQLIVDYRARNGPFKRIEDIMNVKSIGQATFDQIKDQISVED
jgi:competence protein ComEA